MGTPVTADTITDRQIAELRGKLLEESSGQMTNDTDSCGIALRDPKTYPEHLQGSASIMRNIERTRCAEILNARELIAERNGKIMTKSHAYNRHDPSANQPIRGCSASMPLLSGYLPQAAFRFAGLYVERSDHRPMVVGGRRRVRAARVVRDRQQESTGGELIQGFAFPARALPS